MRLTPSLLALVLALVAPLCTGCMSAQPLVPTTPEPAPHGAVPSEQQLRWHDYEFYAFVHFNMNTFTGVEWGHGEETPEQFNPTQFDADQWCSLFKECGLTGVIITAKHHDGFCLWPSTFTEHDVANSPWENGRGDVIKELAQACERHGLFLGIYNSPWDQNNPIYGKDDAAYNQYFVGQMEELLTNYGAIAEVWWDGANGDRGNPEKYQEYDWDAFNETVERLQPEAMIFGGGPRSIARGRGVRWIGNERGYANPTQWATYPAQDTLGVQGMETGLEGAAYWMPAETDVSIRPGWYWNEESNGRVKGVDQLLQIYYESIGHNTTLLLNFPVDNRGLVHENDAAALRQLTRVLRSTFANDFAEGRPATASNVRGDDPYYAASNLTDTDLATYWATDDGITTGSVTVELDGPTVFNQVLLQEHIELGQRVRAWKLEARVNGQWQTAFEGTTIGHKRIARFNTVTADAVRLNIIDSRACPTLESLALFLGPARVEIQADPRVFIDSTAVTITADQPGQSVHYTLDGSVPDASSPRYEGPIQVAQSCTIRAVAVHHGHVSPMISGIELVGHTQADLRQPEGPDQPRVQGLHVARFEGGWQTLDQMADREPVSSGNCTGFDIEQRSRDDHAALAFTGHLTVPRDGIYELFVTSDDGSRLYIGDQMIVENDGLHGAIQRGGSIALKAGPHPIRVEWFNATGGRELQVHWAGPGIPKETIPADALSR